LINKIIAIGTPQLFGAAVILKIWARVFAFRMDRTDKVNAMGIVETAIAVGCFGHGLNEKAILRLLFNTP